MTPKIEKLRDRIAALKESILLVETGQTRLPKAEAIAALDRYLAAHQAEGEHRLIYWTAHFSHPAPRPPEMIYANPNDVFGLSCFAAALAPEQVRARLVGFLEANYTSGPETLSSAERPAWLAAKRAELLKLEIEDFTESNLAKVLQRRDADPRVLLGAY